MIRAEDSQSELARPTSKWPARRLCGLDVPPVQHRRPRFKDAFRLETPRFNDIGFPKNKVPFRFFFRSCSCHALKSYGLDSPAVRHLLKVSCWCTCSGVDSTLKKLTDIVGALSSVPTGLPLTSSFYLFLSLTSSIFPFFYNTIQDNEATGRSISMMKSGHHEAVNLLPR